MEEAADEEEVPPEFECSICMKILLDPVSVPCGHTFCRACLEQSLGYRGQCAVCRAPVAAGQGVNVLIHGIIAERFPNALRQRRREMQEELEATERLADEARQLEARGVSASTGVDANQNNQSAPIPLFRRGELILPHCRDEISLRTEEENRLVRYALQGGRRIGVLAEPRGAAFDDAARPLGVCAEVEGVDWATGSGQEWPCVRVIGKFRFWLVEQPQEHEDGFELGRCEAFFDAPLPPQELTLPPVGDASGASPSDDAEDNLRPLAPAVARSALELVENQLVHVGHGGRHAFNRRFGEIPSLRGGTTTSAAMEQLSFWLLGAIISDDVCRRQWLASIDTRGRLEASHARLRAAGSRPILDLPGARSWMNPAQSAMSSLLLLLAIVALFLAKALGLLDRRSPSHHGGGGSERPLEDLLVALNLR